MQEGTTQESLTAGFPFPMPKVSAEQLPTLAEWNSRYIDYVLSFTKGKKTAAARILGINRRTLYRRNKAKGEDMAEGDMDEMDAQDEINEISGEMGGELNRAVLHEPALGEH